MRTSKIIFTRIREQHMNCYLDLQSKYLTLNTAISAIIIPNHHPLPSISSQNPVPCLSPNDSLSVFPFSFISRSPLLCSPSHSSDDPGKTDSCGFVFPFPMENNKHTKLSFSSYSKYVSCTKKSLLFGQAAKHFYPTKKRPT